MSRQITLSIRDDIYNDIEHARKRRLRSEFCEQLIQIGLNHVSEASSRESTPNRTNSVGKTTHGKEASEQNIQRNRGEEKNGNPTL